MYVLFLQPEPLADAEGVISLRVRLPDGSLHQRRFQAAHQVQDVQDWVQVSCVTGLRLLSCVAAVCRQQ